MLRTAVQGRRQEGAVHFLLSAGLGLSVGCTGPGTGNTSAETASDSDLTAQTTGKATVANTSASTGSGSTTMTTMTAMTRGDETGSSETSTSAGTTGTTGETTSDTDTSGSGEPMPSLPFDLDQNGEGDTDLVIDTCADLPGSTCLIILDSTVITPAEVLIGSGANICDGNVLGTKIDLIGDHNDDGFAEVAALHCRFDGIEGPPALAIVDAAAALRIAQAAAPPTIDYAFAGSLQGPEERRYAFLAPSYGDGESEGSNWMRVCVFRPDLASDPNCGEGFSSIPLSPPAPVFREAGASLQDLDDDGWQDINLIFHRTIYSVSGKTLAPIVSTTYDIAWADEPNSPKWFHSGRNYGAHAAFTAADTSKGLLLVGGSPVGSFSDDLCNVSRFVGLLRAPPGQPGARNLAWSHYFGFSSTIFATYDAKYINNPEADVARLADVVDGCIHRFGSSRSVMDDEPVVVFNYFEMAAPIDYCLKEQYALYQPPTWTQEKADAWYSCFGKNRTSPGTWGMQVLRESDGQGLTGSQGTYIWGTSNRWIEGGEPLYLVEMIPGQKAFDLSDQAPSQLRVLALVDGLWQERGLLPVAGRPQIVQSPGRADLGLGSFSYIAELVRRDIDDDGLDEIALEGGIWIGYNTDKATFVLKEE